MHWHVWHGTVPSTILETSWSSPHLGTSQWCESGSLIWLAQTWVRQMYLRTVLDQVKKTLPISLSLFWLPGWAITWTWPTCESLECYRRPSQQSPPRIVSVKILLQRMHWRENRWQGQRRLSFLLFRLALRNAKLITSWTNILIAVLTCVTCTVYEENLR